MTDYWVVTEKSTGRVIVHCGDERDAIMMVSFDNYNRVYGKQKFIMDQVITVTSTTDKELPGQQGLPSGRVQQLNPEVIKLSEGQGKPVEV